MQFMNFNPIPHPSSIQHRLHCESIYITDMQLNIYPRYLLYTIMVQVQNSPLNSWKFNHSLNKNV